MKKNFFYCFLPVLLCYGCTDQNYSNILQNAIERSVSKKFLEGYEFISYPTNNFGLGSSYQYAISDTSLLCDAFYCIDGETTPPDSMDKFLSVDGLAAVGNDGGAIQFTKTESNDLALNILLPKFLNVIGITANFSKSTTTDLTLSIPRIYKRSIRPDVYKKIIFDPNSKVPSLKVAYQKNWLVVVAADCVIQNLSFSIKINSADTVNLNAKMTGAASKVFTDASLGLHVDHGLNSQYTFTIAGPVIFARIGKLVPPFQTSSADVDILKTWTTEQLPPLNAK